MSLAASKVLAFEVPALSVLPEPVSIEECIQRAQENLLRLQKPDGHWEGELLADATLCCDYVIYMHWLGKVDELPAIQMRRPYPSPPARGRRLEHFYRRSERNQRLGQGLLGAQARRRLAQRSVDEGGPRECPPSRQVSRK